MRRRLSRGKTAGLLVTAVALVLGITVAVVASSRPAHAARRHSAAAATASARSASAASDSDSWVTSWSASPQAAYAGTLAAAGFDDQTVRDIIFPSVGGDPIRLELTNAYGTSPLRVGLMTVAVAGPGGTVEPGTVHLVTFGGGSSVDVPAGGQVLSDPVAMQVEPFQELAVSLYLPDRTGAATFHSDAQQVNWVSSRGAPGLAASWTATESWYYLSALVVRSPGPAGTVVTFGDSITDGYHSAVGANARWPNDLARRLQARPGPALAVADAGISGNRLLAASRFYGASGVSRFARDALDLPGVRDVIVLEGINDIGFSGGAVSAARIIAGYRRLIAAAHARGVRIFGATILPYQGSGYYSAAGEAVREAVNRWIRTSGAFNGVIDFDAVMRDPADPLRLNPAYDSGDHLHPDDAGYQVMANAINLATLLPASR